MCSDCDDCDNCGERFNTRGQHKCFPAHVEAYRPIREARERRIAEAQEHQERAELAETIGFQELFRLARLGAAVEVIGQTHDIGNALTVESVPLLLPIVRNLAQAMTDNEA